MPVLINSYVNSQLTYISLNIRGNIESVVRSYGGVSFITMSRRIKFCSKLMYGLGHILHTHQFKYVVSSDGPNSVGHYPKSKIRRYFAYYSIVVQIILISYFYYEVFFGSMSTTAFFFLIGANAFFILFNIGELYFHLSFYRSRAICIMNYVEENIFRYSQLPTAAYQLVYGTYSFSSVVYPMTWLPILFLISFYFPGSFRTLIGVAEWIGGRMDWSDFTTTFIVRPILLMPFVVGIAHGSNNHAPPVLWICAYLFSTIETLKEMLKTAE